MTRHMSEINLPVFARLMFTKLVQRLTYVESPLWVGLGRRSEPVKYTISEMGGVKEGL